MTINQILSEMVRDLARREWSAECIGCVDDYIDGVESVVNPAISKLIESLAEEIIGEDETEAGQIARDEKLGVQTYYVITANMKRRNQLRAEQRLRVKEIITILK